MNRCILIFSIVALPAGPCWSEEVDELEEFIREVVADGEWVLTQDVRSVTLTRKNVRLLNPVSLPFGKSEDAIWNEFSFESDYRITVTFDTKLSQSEYDAIADLREKFIAKRTQGIAKGSKLHYSASVDADGVLRLPQFHYDGESIYFYSTDEGLLRTRPAAAREIRDRILAILEKKCSKYQTKSEK